MAKVTSDPKAAVEQLKAAQAFSGFMMKNGMPKNDVLRMLDIMLEEILIQYKAAVQEELLETQRQTSDALAAALNMRGNK